MANSSIFFLMLSLIFMLACGFPPLQEAHEMLVIPQTKTLNAIDSCWRSDPTWDSNRQALADCARGFGSGALGGKDGPIYVVTDSSDDPINPKPGTLRFGAIQNNPLWIIFQSDMGIKLQNDLVMNSYKTIDGRGAKVLIGDGPCIKIENVNHVIIHGITMQNCTPGIFGMVRTTPGHVDQRLGSDGDAISVMASSDIWIDHCHFASCADGLVDITHASTDITVSNNYYTQHDKVMLFGHDDGYTADQIMKVTVVFNHFGPGTVQRMPRVRYGYAHLANNLYDQWIMYAIGGSSNPTILSEGNHFIASVKKQVTKRDTMDGPEVWNKWSWGSLNDVFLNGAYFVQSGTGSCSPLYSGSQLFNAASGDLVPSLTSDAGPLTCLPEVAC